MPTEQGAVAALINKKRDQVAKLERDIELLGEIETELRNGSPVADSPSGMVDTTVVRRDDPLPTQIAALMHHRGRPMRTTQIQRELLEYGVTTTSAHGLGPMIASALHRRKDLFEKVERGVYGLKNK